MIEILKVMRLKLKTIFRRHISSKQKLHSQKLSGLQQKIAQRMEIKGMFGPKQRELEQKLHPIHEKMISNKSADYSLAACPILSSVASKYAIMSVGNMPKQIRYKIAKLMLNKTLSILKLVKQAQKLEPHKRTIKINKSMENLDKIDLKVHVLMGDREKSKKLLSNYYGLYRDIALTASKIWQERLKGETGRNK